METQTETEGCQFSVKHEGEPPQSLVVGISEFGLAGLTAVDYLVERLELEKTGCVTTDRLPSITPFEDGRPRHHTRFFSSDDADFTVLAGELFIPPDTARGFADAVMGWRERNSVDGITLLSE